MYWYYWSLNAGIKNRDGIKLVLLWCLSGTAAWWQARGRRPSSHCAGFSPGSSAWCPFWAGTEVGRSSDVLANVGIWLLGLSRGRWDSNKKQHLKTPSASLRENNHNSSYMWGENTPNDTGEDVRLSLRLCWGKLEFQFILSVIKLKCRQANIWFTLTNKRRAAYLQW